MTGHDDMAGRLGHDPYPPETKVHFCRLMRTENWRELADLCQVSVQDRGLFTPGDEIRDLWELLKGRGRLTELPAHLDFLRLHHLSELLRVDASAA